MTVVIDTDRLVLRPWTTADAAAALGVFRQGITDAWLPPETASATDEHHMAQVIRGWLNEDETCPPPAGHWAVELKADGSLIGSCSLAFGAPGADSLKLRWVLNPTAWGWGYATEAGEALIRWAIDESDIFEVFALVQPDNARGEATARRMGMEWVGETGHYGDLKLQVYRARHGDMAYRESSVGSLLRTSIGSGEKIHADGDAPAQDLGSNR